MRDDGEVLQSSVQMRHRRGNHAVDEIQTANSAPKDLIWGETLKAQR